MIKKFWCLIWGHKIREKVYIGKTVEMTNLAGMDCTVGLYRWQDYDRCPRCGKNLNT